MSATPTNSEQIFADLGPFYLECGQQLDPCRVGYRTFGKLNAAKDNAILFSPGYTARTEYFQELAGPKGLFDASRYFVIMTDAFGNGVSTSPSHYDQSGDFPQISTIDIAAANHRLLTNVLRIRQLRAFVGYSMGGMQGFEWLVHHPAITRSALMIAATPKPAMWDTKLWSMDLQIVTDGLAHGVDESIIRRQMQHLENLLISTPAFINRSAEEVWFDAKRSPHSKDREVQLKSMLTHDIFCRFNDPEKLYERLRQTRMIIAYPEKDMMVNPEPAKALASNIGAELLPLPSDCGHWVFAGELPTLKLALGRLLDDQ